MEQILEMTRQELTDVYNMIESNVLTGDRTANELQELIWYWLKKRVDIKKEVR